MENAPWGEASFRPCRPAVDSTALSPNANAILWPTPTAPLLDCARTLMEGMPVWLQYVMRNPLIHSPGL